MAQRTRLPPAREEADAPSRLSAPPPPELLFDEAQTDAEDERTEQHAERRRVGRKNTQAMVARVEDREQQTGERENFLLRARKCYSLHVLAQSLGWALALL